MSYKKELYLSKRALGLCVWAGCKQETGKTLCKEHAARHTEFVQKRYKRYRDKDLCVICGGAVEGRMYACKGCRSLYNSRRKKGGE
jgi:hypothetical protein